MNEIRFSRLSCENFGLNSLDDFIRYEEVKSAWRKIDGRYVLCENEYIMNWDLETCRNTASTVYEGIRSKGFGFGAFDGDKIAGFVYVWGELFGSRNQYIELKLFYTSGPYRGMGIGKKLFSLACEEARKLGAEKLYISSGPTESTQAAYRKLGCVYAEEISPAAVEKYPLDVQLEYLL